MEVKTYQKLNLYPLGSILADGFLADQMKRCKDGIGGHLYELEPEMIAMPYVKKAYVSAWTKEDQAGWTGEISGNYWTGYIQLAYTLNDAEMIKTATDWVNAMLKGQRDDGYLGTYYEEDADKYDDFNGWACSCVLRGLLAFHEATGRQDVLDAVHRCLLWFCREWSGDHKTAYGGPAIIEPMVFTYYLTGDKRLIDFSVDYENYLCAHDYFGKSYKTLLNSPFHYNSDHTAGQANTGRLPALIYSATGNPDYLRASERRIEQIQRHATQLSGAPISGTEYLAPVSAVGETEYCSFAYYNAMYSYMSFITGESKYGDYMEEMFYNGTQGARKKDERAIAYLSAPNQIYATDTSSNAMGDMQVYAPCYPVACCPVNAVVVLPEFVRGMFLHDDAQNVYAVAYGPCILRHGNVKIHEKTMYPFRDTVCFEIEADASFALNLRIPSWCRHYEVRINGKDASAADAGSGYVCVGREWKKGDTVEIRFRMEVKVIRVDDSDAAKKYPLAIKYGALLFSYHIPEKWKPIKGNPMTALPEGWSWYNVTPAFKEAEAKDLHERVGLRRNVISWNIALEETLKPEDITVEEVENTGYVWEDPPIRLHTTCRKAPYLCAVYPQKTFEPYGDYQYVTDTLPLTLVPYGCTNLRITYFPKAKADGNNGADAE